VGHGRVYGALVRRRRWVVALVAVAACNADGGPGLDAAGSTATTSSTSSTSSTTTTASTTTTSSKTTTTAVVIPSTTALPPPIELRSFTDQAYLPMTVVGPVTLTHPSARVERIGFHESTHDGGLDQAPLPSAVSPVVLETRDRGTGPRSAADVVVEPGSAIHAPVSGTVIRGGPYTLYCDHIDEYLVIEPDARPGWEVKVLHVVGLQVGVGDRVVAGETLVALHAHELPFASQVDELRSADPAWPHVHVEVLDPSVPDRPTGPGCG
jgi:biotin carboxyl carrier protein